MKTLFSIVVLIIWSFIASFIAGFILNFAGLPGALLAAKLEEHNKIRFIFSSILSALGQTYVYLAYVAFIVNWTQGILSYQGVSLIIWPITFFAAMLPLGASCNDSGREAKERGFSNTQDHALTMTAFIVIVMFFVFAFFPQTIKFFYSWVPFVGSR